jgi:predicted nucleic-acid-binding Zn-ribbon protein
MKGAEMLKVKTEKKMKCEKCGSTKFYIRGVDITHDYDFERCSREEVEENLMSGNYDNYDYFKGYSQVKCSNCEDVIIDLG